MPKYQKRYKKFFVIINWNEKRRKMKMRKESNSFVLFTIFLAAFTSTLDVKLDQRVLDIVIMIKRWLHKQANWILLIGNWYDTNDRSYDAERFWMACKMQQNGPKIAASCYNHNSLHRCTLLRLKGDFPLVHTYYYNTSIGLVGMKTLCNWKWVNSHLRCIYTFNF